MVFALLTTWWAPSCFCFKQIWTVVLNLFPLYNITKHFTNSQEGNQTHEDSQDSYYKCLCTHTHTHTACLRNEKHGLIISAKNTLLTLGQISMGTCRSWNLEQDGPFKPSIILMLETTPAFFIGCLQCLKW